MKNLLFFILSIMIAVAFSSCKEKTSIFDLNERDCFEGLANQWNVEVANIACEAEGVFLFMEDSIVYSDDKAILPYKGDYGKQLQIRFCFGNRNRYPLCDSESSVLDIEIYNAIELN